MQKPKKKAALISVLLVLYCMVVVTFYVQGQFSARFVSTAAGESNTRIAGIGCDVTYTPADYNNLAFNINSSAIYVVVDEFVVTNTGDVTYNYNLNLRLSADSNGTATYASPTAYPNGSIVSPAKSAGAWLYQIKKNGTDGEISPMDFSAVCGGKTYEQGKIYYGVSTNGVSYTWYNDGKNVTDGAGYETISLPARDLKYAQKHYYKVVYFIDLSTPGTTIPITPASLLYTIKCTQVD